MSSDNATPTHTNCVTMEDRQYMLSTARCLLWLANVEFSNGNFHWKLSPFDLAAAQRFLPLEVCPGETYAIAWFRAKHRQDTPRMADNAENAMRQGKSSYNQEFRCVDKNGQLRWLYEDVLIEQVEENRWWLTGVCTDITQKKKLENRLDRRRRMVSHIADTTPNLLYIYDLTTGSNAYANQRTKSILGDSPEEIQRQGVEFFVTRIHPDDQDVFDEYHKQVATADDGEIIETIYRLKHHNGQWRWLRSRDVVFSRDAYGKPERVLGTAEDITEQKMAADALRASEEKYRILFENSMDAIYITTEAGYFVDVNPSMSELFGYTRNELLNLDVSQLYASPASRQAFQQEIGKTGAVKDYFVKLHKKDGSIMECLLTSTVRLNGSGHIIGYQGIIRDVTQHRRLEREVLEICEAERRRIGSDLHDGLGQGLHGLALVAKGLVRQLQQKGLVDQAQVASEIFNIAKATARYAREVAHELIPVNLEREGLINSLRNLALLVKNRSGISCGLNADGHESRRINTSLENHLYRIAQEAVNNAVKHSKASEILIKLSLTSETVLLTIIDNGVGLPDSFTSDLGLGTHLMQSRANLIGADLKIKRGEGGGTVVRCEVNFFAAKDEMEV